MLIINMVWTVTYSYSIALNGLVLSFTS